MRIGELIAKYRKDNSMSIRSFAEKSGISKSYLSLLENDLDDKRSVTVSKANQIAAGMDMTFDELTALLDDTVISLKDDPEPNVDLIPEVPQVPIKVYGSVPAGIPIEAVETIEDTVYIPKKWLSGGREYIGLKVKGSSMYPKYLEDDTVVIQLQKDCRSGQDAVIYVNGYEATLKTVIKESSGKITLKPINPEYQSHTYGPGDDPIEILGVVKQLIRNI